MPPRVERSWKRAFRKRLVEGRPPPVDATRGWRQAVSHRQRVTFALTLLSTTGALYVSYLTLLAEQMPAWALALYLVVYGLMVFFLASSFFKTMLGTWHALRGAKGNPWHPQHTARDPGPDARVAIVFPVYHEDVTRVAAGIAATWGSIAKLHPAFAPNFDIYLLSDSRKIEFGIAEEAAMHRLGEAFPDGRFFYRRRVINQNAKLGNIVDFCRRWGTRYKYMLVMDADSVMDGDAVCTLLRMMEGNARIGILQTNPAPILRASLFGRMQQFASRLYGSVFSYSLQSMYMGDASYIGHNALIRLKPFIAHCILPTLPGRPPWGGKPLSHDIVESAMMARAGYEVWFLPEIGGSYEETPGNILDFLIRERRWLQGNMQHLRFVFADGLRSIYRETFISGSMAYGSALLWAVFLVVSTFGMFHFLNSGLAALSAVRMLELPSFMLVASTLIFLFMPRILALAIHLERKKAAGFGGKVKLIWSVILETLFSLLFSPILMIYISYFILLWLKGKAISWDAQTRRDTVLPWAVCLRHFGWVSLTGLVCLALVADVLDQVPASASVLLALFSDGWVTPRDLVVWLFPILIGIAASTVVVRVTSASFAGLRSRRLFATPEEIDIPDVVRSVLRWENRFHALLPDMRKPEYAIAYALRDPQFYVWHRPRTRVRPIVASSLIRKIDNGAVLTSRELLIALTERKCFDALHAMAGAARKL